MEVRTVPDQGLADMYLIQGVELNQQFIGQFEQIETMYSEGAPEFFVDQGLYYPTGANYGYIGTGFEPTGDWEDYHGVFGLDGQDIQYIGAENESVPYLYYAPGYGYAQSPYNPYNPFIPGAMIGADGSFIAPQQYYALPSYENSVVSVAYPPMVPQSRPNTMANGVTDFSQVNGAKHNLSSNVRNSSHAMVGDTSRRNSVARVAEGSTANTKSVKQPVPSFSSRNFLSQTQAAAQVLQAGGAQGKENGSSEVSFGSSQLRTVFPAPNGVSGKVKPKLIYGGVQSDIEGNSDHPSEQIWGPRTNASKNQLVVKARTNMAGNPDVQGNITIFVDQYNGIDFPIDYKYAKFFVIKSYSEDDVHKSIKYNVWSSTPNGNRKLSAAYEGAQRMAAGDPNGCPLFLFFSVNASGQFCGIAEMTGPVDFVNNMDFWQQDKWSGCFPVKWHFVKDLPNPNFRHIILENNENKPVTNSRDTQEIPYKKGVEMLRIFKNYTSKTSLFDDFMYYENRQRIMQEERARLLIKSYENPYLVPLVDPPRKLQQSVHDFPSFGNSPVTNKDEDQPTTQNKNNSEANSANADVSRSTVSADDVPNMVDKLKVSSLTINPKELESDVNGVVNSESVGIVTIGSMPVKVKETESAAFLTVGSIPLDPRALQRD